MTAIIGYLVQCEVCPQKALVDGQADDWICPRCAEVTPEPDQMVDTNPVVWAMSDDDVAYLRGIQG